MFSIETHLREEIENAIRKAGFSAEEVSNWEITECKERKFGDLATNVAFLLAKPLKKKPDTIAKIIVQALRVDTRWIDRVDVAGGGFINFTLSKDYLLHGLSWILQQGEKYGRSDIGKGKKTQVEFVSANPTGPLTIGHGRQAVIGDVIARLLEATGHQVTREYYFNNAGRQMRILAKSVRHRYLELLGDRTPFPEYYYQGNYIKEIAAKIRKERGDGLIGEDALPFFQEFAEREIFRDIRTTLERLGVRFDVYYNERSLYETGKIDGVLQALREKGVVYEKEGAIWFQAEQFGLGQDRVIVKSTGEPTYRLPDIAYHKDKLDRGFDLVVDIFGADHIATYPDVLAGLQALGYDTSKIKVLIHQFVTLMEGKAKVKMSTRKANFVTLDELMDEVGVDVTRYFFINRSMSSHLNFDLTLAKTQSEENPVYYVQYAHARISSILRKAEKEHVDIHTTPDLSLLEYPEEMDLIRILLSFPRVVREAVQWFEPHRIPNYLEEVATAYHRFQHAGKQDKNLKVISKNVPFTLARLALCMATKTVLANGLGLLGISAPERM